jgi:hypothetical protein
MEPSVLRGPWPGNRHATLRRGSHERKIVAGYAKSAYPITRKVAQRVYKGLGDFVCDRRKISYGISKPVHFVCDGRG